MPFTCPFSSGSAPRRPKAFFLVGPTAVGKSSVAHLLALRFGYEILSADSMLIYKGMDIGTAKPSASDRQAVPYRGLDLVTPDRTFSAGDYMDYAPVALLDCCNRGVGVIVAGGTGLYIKCLTEGLDFLPKADEKIRQEAERLLQEKGIEALQNLLKEKDPARYEALKDKQNPRRIIRALEMAAKPEATQEPRRPRPTVPLAGLAMSSLDLQWRIEQRIVQMYREGFLDEARVLRERYPAWSATASQAIGYAEALAVLDGTMRREEAMGKTMIRTRQLAKRQMTWFRHQALVEWVTVEASESVEQTAAKVAAVWEKYGPTPIAF
ncbi:MAG: tRNA (adenosine(37)-N6)-dimethylallyltransferase MiaA [Lentisphaerota bacterium]